MYGGLGWSVACFGEHFCIPKLQNSECLLFKDYSYESIFKIT